VKGGTHALIEGEFPNLCMGFPNLREVKRESKEEMHEGEGKCGGV
jgi:hypothetical protein